MAFTHRSRSKAIDNIAVGSAITSRERTIAGALPPDTSTIPGTGENIAVASDYGTERHVAGSTLMLKERLGP